MTRTGKIAKLPTEIREELNRQLERGVPGRVLVTWLNAHPAVRAMLREFFEGAPVNEQNLSAWRRGGFVDWQVRREFFEQLGDVAADAGEFEEAAAKMAGHAARLLSAHYAIALSKLPSPREIASGPAEDYGPCPYAALSARLKPLAAITRTVTALRRADHDAARLKMQTAHQAQQRVPAFASVQSYSITDTDTPPSAAPAERGNQGLSSQIKVQEIPQNPASVASPKPAAPRLPAASETPSSPPHLTLTLPPALHFFATPPVSSQVA